MIPRRGLGEFIRMAGLGVWLGLSGCTSLTTSSGSVASHAATAPRERPRIASQSSPFGEPAAENAVAARPESAQATVRPTAWAKLKGAISRPAPQPIPLPADTSNDDGKADEERPFVSVDGRDF
ncbi:MAG: hypothetical protein IT428_12520 [Planctomycetaceae bacterium]|nr:hypothetical protein [Planctomycetaceae bacterium]